MKLLARQVRWFTTMRRIAIRRSQLVRANLRNQDFSYANLRYADFSGADLQGADLTCADLRGADFIGADLTGVIMAKTGMPSARDMGNQIRLIAPERAVELEALYKANGNSFSGIEIRSRSELLWLQLSFPCIESANVYLDLESADVSAFNLSGVNVGKKPVRGAEIPVGALIVNVDQTVLVPYATMQRIKQAAAISDPKQRSQKAQISQLNELLWLKKASSGWPRSRGKRLNLRGVSLANALMACAPLEDADLTDAELDGADLRRADMHGALGANASFFGALLQGAAFVGARCPLANFTSAHLDYAKLQNANLRGATMQRTSLIGSDLSDADLRGTDLTRADMRGARFVKVKLDGGTGLDHPWVDTTIATQQTDWTTGVNLSQVSWGHMKRLGDESLLQTFPRSSSLRGLFPSGADRHTELGALRTVVAAYRNLARALHDQGLRAASAEYHIRGEQLGWRTLWLEKHSLRWLLSLVLNVTSSYGENPMRLALWYIDSLLYFAVAYWGLAHFQSPPVPSMSVLGALNMSFIAFHGRGLQLVAVQGHFAARSLVGMLSYVETVWGVFLEFIFIAAFTRRFLE